MSTTVNHSSSYSRNFERRVIEEGSSGAGIPAGLSSSSSSRLASILPEDPLALARLTPDELVARLRAGSLISSSDLRQTSGASATTFLHASDSELTVCFDVSHYKPNELTVSVEGGWIVVEAEHEERADELGLVSRKLRRRFALPRHCTNDDVTAEFGADGRFTVHAKAPVKKDASPARTIPIKVTTKPAAAATAPTPAPAPAPSADAPKADPPATNDA